jgi:hypothetical protein
LSDGELIEEIGTFIKGPNIRLHNILLSALISNTARDSPPTEVALWVTDGDDASSSATKPPGGDVTERKLKMEVMGISARERKRLKEVPEKVGKPGGAQDGGAKRVNLANTSCSWKTLRISLGICYKTIIWRNKYGRLSLTQKVPALARV